MIIGVPREIAPEEKRVALVPEIISKLKQLNYQIQVESGAGTESSINDAAYKSEGAEIIDDVATLYANADILLKVQGPLLHPQVKKHELEMMKVGAYLIGFFFPLVNVELVKKAAKLGINIMAMDSVPRITKAQRMDALSSQTNLAGYKAVIMAADALDKIFPLMMTAAGTIAPAKVLIMGAGVAGLQAIATAKRLGAVVEVTDVRPAVKEEVESLGGKFIDIGAGAEQLGEGGYAKSASEDFIKKQQEILTAHVAESDVVITTALIPGKKAPVLLTEAMVKKMRAGSVIVDMAAEQGGNCESSEKGKTVIKDGVTIIGEINLPALVPLNASELYSRNLFSLIKYLSKDGKLELNQDDEIVKGMLIVHNGEVIDPQTRELVGQTG